MEDPIVRVFTWIAGVIGTIIGGLLNGFFRLLFAYPKVMLPLIALTIAGIVVAVKINERPHQDQVRLVATTSPARTPTPNALATSTAATSIAATTSASATTVAVAQQTTATAGAARAMQPTPYAPIPGSWAASAAPLHIRFFAFPSWEAKPELSGSDRLSLGTAASGTEFEALDIYRFQAGTAPDVTGAWNAETEKFSHAPGISDFAITSGPRPQQAARYNGAIGQYHYTQTGNGVRIDGTFWVGMVNGDRVVMNFRCDPAQDQSLDQAVAQVLGTIDFDAA